MRKGRVKGVLVLLVIFILSFIGIYVKNTCGISIKPPEPYGGIESSYHFEFVDSLELPDVFHFYLPSLGLKNVGFYYFSLNSFGAVDEKGKIIWVIPDVVGASAVSYKGEPAFLINYRSVWGGKRVSGSMIVNVKGKIIKKVVFRDSSLFFEWQAVKNVPALILDEEPLRIGIYLNKVSIYGTPLSCFYLIDEKGEVIKRDTIGKRVVYPVYRVAPGEYLVSTYATENGRYYRGVMDTESDVFLMGKDGHILLKYHHYNIFGDGVVINYRGKIYFLFSYSQLIESHAHERNLSAVLYQFDPENLTLKGPIVSSRYSAQEWIRRHYPVLNRERLIMHFRISADTFLFYDPAYDVHWKVYIPLSDSAICQGTWAHWLVPGKVLIFPLNYHYKTGDPKWNASAVSPNKSVVFIVKRGKAKKIFEYTFMRVGRNRGLHYDPWKRKLYVPVESNKWYVYRLIAEPE